MAGPPPALDRGRHRISPYARDFATRRPGSRVHLNEGFERTNVSSCVNLAVLPESGCLNRLHPSRAEADYAGQFERLPCVNLVRLYRKEETLRLSMDIPAGTDLQTRVSSPRSVVPQCLDGSSLSFVVGQRALATLIPRSNVGGRAGQSLRGSGETLGCRARPAHATLAQPGTTGYLIEKESGADAGFGVAMEMRLPPQDEPAVVRFALKPNTRLAGSEVASEPLLILM
jgi:hypothetical protein